MAAAQSWFRLDAMDDPLGRILKEDCECGLVVGKQDAMDDPLGRILKVDLQCKQAGSTRLMQWTIRWVGY